MKKIFIPPVFVFISIFLIVFFCFLTPDFNWIPFPFNFCGILITFSGFAIIGKTWELFRKNKTTLLIKTSSFFITDGIFSKTRNPMYLGMFLLLFGVAVCFTNLFSIITAFSFLLLMHFVFIPKEEKLMFETFGDEYLDYKKKVRKWI
ncbi:MAG: hypothetical protein A2W90_06580 [Bacteroidetes bacterium GWF2_42_66]|nr:MAG: hypothetical protein A2W92_02080 [Bacteroidetes bacterium GWA2_42_15]OFY02820.1 MAG: hypothetical protein A2W89_23990 [Bacteroidetes bacterium GWE2_42_39]OFY44474.1 MAG: hypothetical protein A2W90_06580 [Bacteroidetes bacterium GWF2_42_66]HBL74981.1 hypothetical protein [Prolixibacteraceae bacterium]HCR90080.1 hypothetical protein [Prolixibacteraceae bacterium]